MFIPLDTYSGKVDNYGPGQVDFSQARVGCVVKQMRRRSTEPSSTVASAASHFCACLLRRNTTTLEKLSLCSQLSGVWLFSGLLGGLFLTAVIIFTSCSLSTLQNSNVVSAQMQLMLHPLPVKQAQFSLWSITCFSASEISLVSFCTNCPRSHFLVLTLKRIGLCNKLHLSMLAALSAWRVMAIIWWLVIQLISMLGKEKQEAAMNLPVGSHIDRLAEMIASMRGETQFMQKELQILRGSITQLSYINKESDRQLNSFLIDSIASLRNKWSAEWDHNTEELAEQRKRLAKFAEQHEDIEITRQELEEKVMGLEAAVGLRVYE